MRHFRPAPWPTSLKTSSVIGGALLAGVGYAAYRAVPPFGFAHTFGSLVACVPPAIALLALFFVVLGYEIGPGVVRVRRLLWTTAIPLGALESARHDAGAIKGSLRVFGNAGLFSFTGVYQNSRLGRFRLFATDPASAVVLRGGGRVVVVTPTAPHAFVAAVTALATAPAPPRRPGELSSGLLLPECRGAATSSAPWLSRPSPRHWWRPCGTGSSPWRRP
jgi:hypothetical protein